jgi:hypothetical protein
MRGLRSIGALAAGSLTVLLAIGCNATEDETPTACLEGARPYLKALDAAPAEVRLEGETPIGDCLAENQRGGDLATVGTAMVTTATRLNAAAREEPGGDANLRLGYLLGAATRGATETGGIHADLIRRLEAAARYSPGGRPLQEKFERTYRVGFEAGEGSG